MRSARLGLLIYLDNFSKKNYRTAKKNDLAKQVLSETEKENGIYKELRLIQPSFIKRRPEVMQMGTSCWIVGGMVGAHCTKQKF